MGKDKNDDPKSGPLGKRGQSGKGDQKYSRDDETAEGKREGFRVKRVRGKDGK